MAAATAGVDGFPGVAARTLGFVAAPLPARDASNRQTSNRMIAEMRVIRINSVLSGGIPMTTTLCATCGRTLRQGMSFTFKLRQGEADKCLVCSLRHWPMLRRSLLTSLVVGTILTLLNHGDEFLAESWTLDLYWKIPLTYCVPFLVVTWGALTNSRR